MRSPLRITSADNARLKSVLHLRRQRDRRGSGLFIAEGSREISRALEAGLKIQELFYSPQMAGLDAAGLAKRFPRLAQHPISLYELTPSLLQRIAYNENPEGLLALFEQPIRSFADVPSASPAHPDLWLVAAGINKPGNLGAMARTALAAGATGLLAADAVVDSFNPNAIRASTGAVFTLPIFSASTQETLDFLRARGIRVLAATPDADRSYTDADLTVPCALVIGAEDTGVSADWRDMADESINIPMQAQAVDSLNASSAAAILLFEALRQRRGRK
ncbi:MAG TPA: RNA methyltransferase [Tepidisphaeraceae bacterium]|jgi:TrmH family RNA methyltransferase